MQLRDNRSQVCALDKKELSALPKGEPRKALIALAVKRETTVLLGRIAENSHMGTPSTVSRELGTMAKRLPKERRRNTLSNKLVGTEGGP